MRAASEDTVADSAVRWLLEYEARQTPSMVIDGEQGTSGITQIVLERRHLNGVRASRIRRGLDACNHLQYIALLSKAIYDVPIGGPRGLAKKLSIHAHRLINPSGADRILTSARRKVRNSLNGK